MGTTRTGRWLRAAAAAGFAALASAPGCPRAETPAPAVRVALVVGEGAYRAGPLPAAANDAGLVAQALAGAGFAVTAARDLDGEALRRALRDFLERAGDAGPDGIAMVYFAGRAVQADGDDYLVPVDARLARPSDVPVEALRLADITRALAGLPIQARVVVVDGARAGGPMPGAPGLALAEAEQGELLAFDAAPGTVAPADAGPYGAYAQALVAEMRAGGVPAGEVFDRVRLAVDRATGGAVVPYDSDRLTRPFAFFDRAAGAPAAASVQVPFSALEKRPLRDLPAAEAYDLAVARDTLPAYAEFLAAFERDPLAARVRRLAAVRREALFWRAALGGNSPGAYWTYLARYPRGPHAADARRRLARLAAAPSPPPRFAPLAFDVPPPGPGEGLDGAVVLVGPDLPPPPPPPVFLLPPLPDAPPPRPAPAPGPLLLPIPVPVAVPYVRPPVEPGSIAPPRGAAGAYPQPRPYARGPNGDGLVAGTAPEPPRLGRAAAPAPGVPGLPAAPATPAAPVQPGMPIQHASGPHPSPPHPAPAKLAAPIPPIASTPSVAGPHPAPIPSGASAPPLARPVPAGGSPTSQPHGPPSAAPRAAPVPEARPQPPMPLAEPAPRRLPTPPAAQPQPHAAPAAPRPEPAPVRPPAPPHPQIPEPRPAAPDRPASDRPASERLAPEHAGPGHPPAERRPPCGQPGAPPCRP